MEERWVWGWGEVEYLPPSPTIMNALECRHHQSLPTTLSRMHGCMYKNTHTCIVPTQTDSLGERRSAPPVPLVHVRLPYQVKSSWMGVVSPAGRFGTQNQMFVPLPLYMYIYIYVHTISKGHRTFNSCTSALAASACPCTMAQCRGVISSASSASTGHSRPYLFVGCFCEA